MRTRTLRRRLERAAERARLRDSDLAAVLRFARHASDLADLDLDRRAPSDRRRLWHEGVDREGVQRLARLARRVEDPGARAAVRRLALVSFRARRPVRPS